jgi:DNA-binding beta-propeller fold protein YncE
MKNPFTPSAQRMGLSLITALVMASCGGGSSPTGEASADGARASKAAAANETTLRLLAGNMDGPGNVDGTGAAARFDAPGSIHRRRDGTFLVADKNNKAIRIVSPAGVVSTLFRNPSGASAEPFALPEGVVHDDNTGRTYVTDRQKHVIHSIEADGQVRVFAGTPWLAGSADGAGDAARFNTPLAITVGVAGRLFVVDRDNNAIRTVDATGVVGTLTGQLEAGPAVDDVPADQARFNQPVGIAFALPPKHFAPSGQNDYRVFISDTRNHVIRYYSAHERRVRILAGRNGVAGSTDGVGAAALFERPEGLAVNDLGDYLAVADTGNNTVRRIYIGPGERFGSVETVAGLPGQPGDTNGPVQQALLQQPAAVAFDAADDLLLTDFASSTVRRIVMTAPRSVRPLAGAPAQSGAVDGAGALARFRNPSGLWLEPDRVLVADSGNHLIRALAANNVVTRVAGQGQAGANDGSLFGARFNNPTGLARPVTGGLVYVADSGNSTLRVIDRSANQVRTVAGLAGQPGNTDGNVQQSRFGGPQGLAAWPGVPQIYITDRPNHNVRWYDESTGLVATAAGPANSPVPAPGFVDGIGPVARFNQPTGITSAGPGLLYVLDIGNRAVRKMVKLANNSWSVSTLIPGLVLNDASAIAVDEAGNIYVSDARHVIRRFSPAGADLGVVAGTPDMQGFVPGAAPGVIDNARGMAIRDGRLVFTGVNGVAEIDGLQVN